MMTDDQAVPPLRLTSMTSAELRSPLLRTM